MQYPFVSKTLRDIYKPKNERQTHCCAMTLQNQGVGYDDLNELLKNPTNLEFTMGNANMGLLIYDCMFCFIRNRQSGTTRGL